MDCYCSDKWPVCTRVSIFKSESDEIELGKECDTIICGSLTRGLKKIGIVPSVVTSSDIRKSASTLMRDLQLLRCYTLREPQIANSTTSQHSSCAFTGRLTWEIDYINDKIVPQAVNEAIDDSFQGHMKEQAEK